MRSGFVLALVLAPLSLSSLACPLLHRPGATDGGVVDGGASAADAATAAAPPAADNVNEVARFPDETNLNDTAAKVADPKIVARNSVPSGAVVASLPVGTSVVQVASHDSFILCSFTDPKNSSRTLIGWVGREAFVPGPSPAPKGGCPAGMQRLAVEDQPFCGKVCNSEKDCPKNETCSGRANTYGDAGLGPEVDTCTVPPPGTVPSTPSGGMIVGVQQPPLANGSCAAKYVLASDKLCHFDCTKSPLQCPPKSRCTAKLTNPKQPVCEEAP